MKGFIEVHCDGKPRLINLGKAIEIKADNGISLIRFASGDGIYNLISDESYDKIKQLIEEAQQ